MSDFEDRALMAWAAGFFDGEGHVGLKTRTISRSYAPRLMVVQVDKTPLLIFRGLFGGSIIKRKPGPRCRPPHAWDLTGKDKIYTALTGMLPWLTVKRNAALLLIEYVEEMRAGATTRGHDRRLLTEAEIERRDQLALRLRELNRKGA